MSLVSARWLRAFRTGFRTAAEDVGDEIHCVCDIDELVAIAVSSQQRVGRWAATEDVGNKKHGVSDIDEVIAIGIPTNEVTGIAYAILVGVELQGVIDIDAVVTSIAYAILVEIQLLWVEDIDAVVTTIA